MWRIVVRKKRKNKRGISGPDYFLDTVLGPMWEGKFATTYETLEECENAIRICSEEYSGLFYLIPEEVCGE